MPYLVLTVVPSTKGSKSRCTPWRETSAPPVSERLVILSISSRNTMPFCSTLCNASSFRSSSFTSLSASSSVSSLKASRTFSLRCFLRVVPRFWNMPCSCAVRSSMPGGAKISMLAPAALSSISMSLSSSAPSRSILRNFCRVADSAGLDSLSSRPKPASRAGGSKASSTRSSAASSARNLTCCMAWSRPCFTAISIRSRMMVSTSRPT